MVIINLYMKDKFYFAIPISEFNLDSLTIIVIAISSIVFIVLFVIASSNLDAKGVFDWMLEKPEDWIGKKEDE